MNPISQQREGAGVYIHIPFCAKKCGYCDFNAYSGYKEGTKARYVDALCREIAARAEPQAPVPTIFFGGGTPTQLSARDLSRILQTVYTHFAVAPDAEISTEANPGDASPTYLSELRAAGFNRLSFGVQTFDDGLLRTIDRLHSGHEAEQAIRDAKAAGFTNLSLDLMFALPRQTLGDWERSLDRALALDIPHLSLYALILEENTPFWGRRERGKLPPLPSEDGEATMFERAIARTTEAGYRHYEVSNYARPGFECRHNAIYWRNESYFGFGAGAVAYRNGVRSMNIKRPSHYIAAWLEKSREFPLTAWEETLLPRESMGETLMVGLRLRGGIDLSAFADRFGQRAETVFAEPIAYYTRNGLLETVNGHLRLTDRGLFLGSEVMAAFLS